MKKVFYLTLTALFCFIVLTACDKKQHAMDNFSDFLEKVEKHASEYTEEDWTNVNKEYDELITEIDKYDYSGDDAKRIATLKGKFAGIKTKNTVNKFIDDIDKAAKEVKGGIEGFADGIIGSSKEQE